MSSGGPSPSPEPIKQKKKSKDKSKKKLKSSDVIITEHGKDEGTNPHWDYVPPEGTILLDHDVDSGEFDWDAVKNDEDVELWLLRIPDGVSTTCKFQHNSNLTCTGKTQVLGECSDRHALLVTECNGRGVKSQTCLL